MAAGGVDSSGARYFTTFEHGPQHHIPQRLKGPGKCRKLFPLLRKKRHAKHQEAKIEHTKEYDEVPEVTSSLGECVDENCRSRMRRGLKDEPDQGHRGVHKEEIAHKLFVVHFGLELLHSTKKLLDLVPEGYVA